MAGVNVIKCFVLDDEISAVHNICLALEQHCPQTIVTGHAQNVDDAFNFLSAHETDILFLDIRLQNETGFDLLKKLGQYKGSIIFVTAHDVYGIQAIKFSATDYLLKPIDHHELVEAVQKAVMKKREQSNQEQIAMLIQSFENMKTQHQKRIALPETSEIRYILIEDIIFCQSDNSYTTFYIHNAEKITVSKPISDYENILEPYGFVRVHQSYLVNKNRILAYKKEDGGYLLMENNFQVLVSRQRKHLLKVLFED